MRINELVDEFDLATDAEEEIINQMYVFGRSRLGQLEFMISLFVPWVKYILNPEEANQEFPHCVPREDAPGQPWDIAGGDVVQPEEKEIIALLKAWLKTIYDELKNSVGHTPLPNFYNVMYGGEIIIHWGQFWLLSDKNDVEEKMMEIATDTKTARVIHKAIKDGMMPPPLDTLYDVFLQPYDSAEHRAREVAKFLEIKEPRPERKASVTDMMRDATVGVGGELTLTDTGIEWTIFEDEDTEFVMSKLGMSNANITPQWKKTWKKLGAAASAGNKNEAKQLAAQLIEEI